MKKFNQTLLFIVLLLASTPGFSGQKLVKTMPLGDGITTSGYVRVIVRLTEQFTSRDIGIILHEDPDFLKWDQGIAIMMFSAVGQPAQIRGYDGTTWNSTSTKDFKVGDKVALWFHVDIANAKHSLSAQGDDEEAVTSVFSDFTSRASIKNQPATNAKFCSVFVNDVSLDIDAVEIVEDATIVNLVEPYFTPAFKFITYGGLDAATNSPNNPDQYLIGKGINTLEAAESTDPALAFAGWFTDEQLTAQVATPAISTSDSEDKFFYAKWESAVTLTVTYNPNGGQNGAVSQELVAKGATPALIAPPVKEGYDFTGWMAGSTPFDKNYIVTENIEVTASWEETVVEYFHLTALAFNGSITKSSDKDKYTKGETVVLTAAPNDGYEFIGWKGDQTGADTELTVTLDKDVFVTANFRIITAIKNADLLANLTVFPNPCKDAFSIEIGSEKEADYSIYSTDGRIIQSGSFISSDKIQLVNNLNGLYLLEVRCGDDRTIKKILVTP